MRQPLANDSQGNPIDLPELAAAWRIRKTTGRQGPQQVIYERSTGAPLLLDIAATGEDLRAAGCDAGKYRLEACDADGASLGVVAFTEIDDGDGKEGAPP